MFLLNKNSDFEMDKLVYLLNNDNKYEFSF